jgi:hypothetical protein
LLFTIAVRGVAPAAALGLANSNSLLKTKSLGHGRLLRVRGSVASTDGAILPGGAPGGLRRGASDGYPDVLSADRTTVCRAGDEASELLGSAGAFFVGANGSTRQHG